MRRRFVVLLCVLTVVAASCTRKTQIAAPIVQAPGASSPTGVVRLFEWCWNNRAIEEYATIFTDDYRFLFALGDSAGNAYRDKPWTREDELASATALFVGTADHPAASEIELSLTSLKPLVDNRPGKNPRWHKSIRTRVELKITFDRGGGPDVSVVSGYARFYLVRGDSAAIPPDLVARGFRPDSTRWWIDRMEDETLPPGGAHAHPAQNRTWGAIKALFR